MSDATAVARWSLPIVAVLAAAANMRIGIVEVGPLIETLRADLSMSSAVAGVLTAIPFLCSGAFAFAGAGLVRQLGAHRTVRLALALVVLGTAGRAIAPEPVTLLLATVPIGVGIAWLGIALATVIKADFPDRAGALTGWYIAAMSAAAAVVSVLIVPLRDATDSWRTAFALTALPAVAALALWFAPRLRREHALPRVPRDAGGRAPFSRRGALVLAAIFGLQSICFTTMISWVAAVYREAGWSDGTAALATTSIPVLTVAASLLVPVVSRPATRRPWILATGVVMAVSLVLVALTPTSAAPVWLLLFGLSSGAIFPLVMTLPLDLAHDPADVGRLTGWMLGVGYLISGVGPTLAGALRDASGGFETPLMLMAALALGAGLLSRSRLIDEIATAR